MVKKKCQGSLFRILGSEGEGDAKAPEDDEMRLGHKTTVQEGGGYHTWQKITYTDTPQLSKEEDDDNVQFQIEERERPRK